PRSANTSPSWRSHVRTAAPAARYASRRYGLAPCAWSSSETRSSAAATSAFVGRSMTSPDALAVPAERGRPVGTSRNRFAAVLARRKERAFTHWRIVRLRGWGPSSKDEHPMPPPPMNERYESAPIESKWQARWEKDGLFRSNQRPAAPKK